MLGYSFYTAGVFLITLFVADHPAVSIQKVNPISVLEQVLWEANEADVSLYRIPVISYTPNGNLIAAVEARKYAGGDAGPKFLSVRRSLDEGDNWEPQKFILDDGSALYDGINLGVIIVDDVNASIFIFFGICSHYDKCNTSSLLYTKSIDDGVTWERPVNVSEQIGTKVFAPGPGYGIQKKLAPYKGRLIVCGHSTLEGDGVFCILSDDNGKTWRNGGSLKSIPYNKVKKFGDFVPDECQPVEMSDGSVLVHIRNQNHYHCYCRIIARSYDGGSTFLLDDLTFELDLQDTGVAAGALFHNGVMFFSNPNSQTSRTNMTLQWSYDNGTTWAGQLAIWPKASAYSAMTAIPSSLGNYIYVIYEKGLSSAYELVSLVRINIYGGL